MNHTSILYLFTRTPLHVGAGASVGAIDQPIIRERHTGFPIIPASSLKGSFADYWNSDSEAGKRNEEAAWLFGSDNDKSAAAGALQFGEARLLAFPIRSAKGSFAWITCPLILARAARDGILEATSIEKLPEPSDNEAIFDSGTESKVALGNDIVLEEYAFKSRVWEELNGLGKELSELITGDPVWKEIQSRLVILSNGMMSFFARNACEVAQHVRIDDITGTAAEGALFNQENVPSETLFYSVLHATGSRLASSAQHGSKKANEAVEAFRTQLLNHKTSQFGGDASTGLGYCTVRMDTLQGS